MRYLFLFILLLSSAANAQVHRYEYYGDLPFWESPVQAFRGQTPLTLEQSKTRGHARVGYDQLNRIVEIQARQGESFKQFSRGFGNLYVHAVDTRISYSDEMEVHSFYDHLGNRIEVLGQVWEKRYTKDKYGRNIRLNFVNKAGDKIDNRFGYSHYEWAYPGDGSVVENRFNLEGEAKPHRPGFEFMRIRMVFDADGHLRLMQNVDDKLQPVASKSGAAQYRYFYNSFGAFDRWEVLDEQGKPALGPTGTAGEQYTYNHLGWTKIAFFDQQLKPTKHASGAVNWHAEYDDFGNMTARWFTDEKGQAISGRYGFHKVRYHYDKKGLQQIRQEYYDVNEKITNNIDGVATVHFKRHEDGRLMEKRNTDKNNQLAMDAWNSFAVETFEYDQSGTLTNSTKYNLEGEEVE